MNKFLITDWRDFGHREIKMAVILLSHMKDEIISIKSEPKIYFNNHTGDVFISNTWGDIWMMNGDKLEKIYMCTECGEKDFIDKLRNNGNECCKSYLIEESLIEDGGYLRK